MLMLRGRVGRAAQVFLELATDLMEELVAGEAVVLVNDLADQVLLKVVSPWGLRNSLLSMAFWLLILPRSMVSTVGAVDVTRC